MTCNLVVTSRDNTSITHDALGITVVRLIVHNLTDVSVSELLRISHIALTGSERQLPIDQLHPEHVAQQAGQLHN